MRRLMLLTAGALLAAAGPVQAQQAGLKIGYINSQEILDQDPGAIQAQEQFNQEMASFRTEVQNMAQELDRMIQQYEQQQLTLSPQAKEQREQAILAKRQEYDQRVQQLDQQAGQRQQELVQPVMDRITQVIEEIRGEGSYALIFDVAAGSIIAADESLDLTAEVLRRLQNDENGASTGPGER